MYKYDPKWDTRERLKLYFIWSQSNFSDYIEPTVQVYYTNF